MKNIIKKLIIITIVLGVLVGCSNSKIEKNKTINDNKEVVKAYDLDYPVHYMDTLGRETIIEKEPSKVISLAPNITETIFALGKGDILIGRTDYCLYPEKALDVEVIGSIMEPNIEKVVELMPDFVLVSSIAPVEAIEQLRNLGIKVISIKNEESFESTYNTIEDIGIILGVKEKAVSIVEEMKSEVEMVVEKVKDAPKVRTYYVITYGDYGDYTPGGGTFINDVITMAGGINVAENITGWKYSKEKLIEDDPEVIITKPEDMEGFKIADGYKELRAVKENKVKTIDASLLEIQSTRIGKGLQELAKLLHPELFNE